MRPDQERVRTLLTDTVTLLCKNGLQFSKELKVQGLLGITTDDNDVFVVHINECFGEAVDHSDTADDAGAETSTQINVTSNRSTYSSQLSSRRVKRLSQAVDYPLRPAKIKPPDVNSEGMERIMLPEEVKTEDGGDSSETMDDRNAMLSSYGATRFNPSDVANSTSSESSPSYQVGPNEASCGIHVPSVISQKGSDGSEMNLAEDSALSELDSTVTEFAGGGTAWDPLQYQFPLGAQSQHMVGIACLNWDSFTLYSHCVPHFEAGKFPVIVLACCSL